MMCVELFSGTGSFSHIARMMGFRSITVDNEADKKPDIVADLLYFNEDLQLKKTLAEADIVWMSPPCTTFSMAAGNKHWTRAREQCKKCCEWIE